MAQLDNEKVKMGHLIKMSNEKQRFGEATEYYALKVENPAGDVERWLLLTTNEVDRFKSVVLDGVDFKLGQLHIFMNGKKNNYLVKIAYAGEERLVMVSSVTIDRGINRAVKNPEDIPHQSKLADMLD